MGQYCNIRPISLSNLLPLCYYLDISNADMTRVQPIEKPVSNTLYVQDYHMSSIQYPVEGKVVQLLPEPRGQAGHGVKYGLSVGLLELVGYFQLVHPLLCAWT